MTENGSVGKYETQIRPHLALIRRKLAQNVTIAELVSELGVSRTTFNRLRKQHPELGELFQEAASSADDQVEAALLRRATGYEKSDGKEVPPDVRAAVFWLKNRRPGQWKDRREVNLSEPIAITFKTEERDL